MGDGEEDRSVSAILVGEEEGCVGFSGAEWEDQVAEEKWPCPLVYWVKGQVTGDVPH